ncbi:MAG: hypothetical protein EPO00_03960 [Chloroflexota bacterium]|nr:MAG: hypothetical protein EPO00_03960 [Chloroflexota bacterium]
MLGTAGIAGVAVGGSISAAAIGVMIVSTRTPVRLQMAVGFVLVGFSIMTASTAVFLISRLGERLPLLAGIPPIAVLIAVALGLRIAASVEFRRARSSRDGGPPE